MINFELSLLILIVFLIFLNVLVYFLYPLYIHIHSIERHLKQNEFSSSTEIFHIIPAYNEEEVIEDKILNSLKIEFPHKSKTIVVIDKSTDRSQKIAIQLSEKFKNKLEVIAKPNRKGKNDSINLAIAKIKPGPKDILFFSDCNTFFDVEAFLPIYEKLKMGYNLVGGSMHYLDEQEGTSGSEGLYWKYEEWIRSNEAKMGRCLVVNGGNFGMIAENFVKLPDFVPNDFESPLRLCGSNIPVGFTNNSIGYEKSILNAHEEYKRKKRMANRQMNCIMYLWNGLNFQTKIQILIRKVLRWCGFHIFIISLFLAAFCFYLFNGFFVSLIFYIELITTLLIIVAVILNPFVSLRIVSALNHVVFVHISSFNGMILSIFGKRTSIWEKAESNRHK